MNMSQGELINSYKEVEELLSNDNLSFDNLKYLAKEVSANSWSPYSNFHVGAVVVGIDQNKKVKVFSGTNVEPTVFSSVCAERVAIFNGIAAGYKKFIAIAISIPKAQGNINNEINKFTPCGACREVMIQKMIPKGIVLLDGTERTFTSKELLPRPILDISKLKNLTIEEMDTLELARNALHNAHTPYSKEKYGVAILVEDSKEKFVACTLDSASFGCSSEPLKSAFGLYTAKGNIKNQKNKIKSIAFAYPFIRYPTGDVLQLISDYCEPGTKIIIDNMGISTIEELLPWAFKL